MNIESCSFGSFVIAGKEYGDIKIYKNNITSRQYIKHHVFTKKDIADIVEGIDFLVMGIGYSGMVTIEDDVLPFLEKKGITAIIQQTEQAVQEYNALAGQGQKVAAILHSTC